MRRLSRQSLWRMLLAAAALGLVLSAPGRVEARDGAGPKSELWSGDRNLAKVSTRLLRARGLARSAMALPAIAAELPALRFAGRRVAITVGLRKLTPEILARLEEAGLRVTGASYRWGRVAELGSLEILDEIAALPEVTTIRPSYRPRARADPLLLPP